MASDPSVIERLNAALTDRYQIESEIGSGGMATVYLAQDLRHNRKVAVKVLKPELAAVVGTERFLAEIQTTANLSHPHILPLFDSGEADGFLFYVMPHVEGESLRQRLDRDGQLAVEDAVGIAGHVADALESAHRHGVIHRDIKPGNILFQEGEPVVSDFGIALAVSAAGEGRLTETGLSLGTPYYMSPEQAAGDQSPTAASDVYSLGCVLYEMLTGEPPHTGASAQAILGKILLADVTRPTKLRRTIPANVEGAVLKALERLPADRFESATELASALKEKGFRHGVGVGAGETDRRWKVAAVALGIVAVLTSVWAVVGGFRSEPRPVSRFAVSLPPDSGLHMRFGPSIALSRDGSQMVYVGPGPEGGAALWVKDTDQFEPRLLPGTEEAYQPFFSPDGRRIGFIAAGDTGPRTLKVLSLQGGRPVELVDVEVRSGGSWGVNGFIYVAAEGGGIGKVPESGGEVSPVTTLAPDESAHLWPQVLPDGRAVIFTVLHSGLYTYSDAEIAVADLATGEHRILTRGALARFSPTGHLLVVGIDGTLSAVPFDADNLAAGDPVVLTEGVLIGSSGNYGSADLALSEEGTLVYVVGELSSGSSAEVVWVDRAGNSESVDPEWGQAEFATLALSSDGRRLAVDIAGEGARQIWVKELPDGPVTRLTTDEGASYWPAWSPDGETVAYHMAAGSRAQIGSIFSDGRSAGAYEVLLEGEHTIPQAAYTPDGAGLLFYHTPPSSTPDLGYLDLTTGERNDSLLATEFSTRAPVLSPDGRWLAYTSNATGRDEVFVRPFPEVDAYVRQVSRDGGTEPVWAREGAELFYRGGDDWMMVASYSADPTFNVEERTPLFDASAFRSSPNGRNYDVTRDGDRFVMTLLDPAASDGSAAGEPRLVMIQNFFTELKERVGGGR